MKKAIWVALAMAIVILFISQSNSSKDAYENEINNYWEEKEDFYQNSEASPFVQRNQPYKPIFFFDPDKDYKVTATLERFSKREILAIGNSDGTTTNYLKFASATFKVKGVSQTILILKLPRFGNQYLTAFGDETSGVATYGGGRYLDLEIGKSDRITIDFNKAYNPYCAYFDDYACPLPPRENLLTVSIKAGEKY